LAVKLAISHLIKRAQQQTQSPVTH
jgi:hypothetical protein